MAEEVQNADVVVPWAMVSTTVLNGALGFGTVVAVLFVTTDVESALTSTTGALGYPYMDIFFDSHEISCWCIDHDSYYYHNLRVFDRCIRRYNLAVDLVFRTRPRVPWVAARQ